MTLFRDAKIGDIVRKKGVIVFPIQNEWYREHVSENKDEYEFVTVTPIEPPPPPQDAFVNLYKTSEGKIRAGGSLGGYKSRKLADKMAQADRVGCINLRLLEGRWDE